MHRAGHHERERGPKCPHPGAANRAAARRRWRWTGPEPNPTASSGGESSGIGIEAFPTDAARPTAALGSPSSRSVLSDGANAGAIGLGEMATSASSCT